MFLRKNAHDFLEMLRTRRIAEAAVTLQRVARGFVYRKVFFATKHAIVLIQRMSRGFVVRVLPLTYIYIYISMVWYCKAGSRSSSFCLASCVW